VRLSAAAFRPRIANSHRADEVKRCEPFLGWLRKRPCFLSVHAPRLHRCEGRVRACHFDPWGDKGVGTKVSDCASLPMCDAAHAEQTDVLGWPDFQSKYEFDGRDVVTVYWLEWSESTENGVKWIKRQMERGYV
jgi:hypothetical protein